MARRWVGQVLGFSRRLHGFLIAKFAVVFILLAAPGIPYCRFTRRGSHGCGRRVKFPRDAVDSIHSETARSRTSRCVKIQHANCLRVPTLSGEALGSGSSTHCLQLCRQFVLVPQHHKSVLHQPALKPVHPTFAEMMFSRLTTLLPLALGRFATVHSDAQPTVQLDHATVYGTMNGSVTSYLNIPFAQPPYALIFGCCGACQR